MALDSPQPKERFFEESGNFRCAAAELRHFQCRGKWLIPMNIWFRLNAYLEADVHNRPSGVKLTLRISKFFSLRSGSDGKPSGPTLKSGNESH